MKKILSSVLFVLAFGAYVLYQNLGSVSASAPLAASVPVETPITAPVAIATSPAPQPSHPKPTPAPTPVPTPTPTPTPTPAPAPKPKGQYVDGTYTGSVADAYYGLVQVEAIISGGKLADVRFLQYPNDRSTSREINGQAMPMLTQEAIRAQSASVDGVSGASDTSAAFVESLGSALAQAKA